MIHLVVRYYNVLRTAAGVAEEIVSVPEGARLLALLEQVGDLHGAPLRGQLFDAGGAVAHHLVVFRNCRLVPQPWGAPGTAACTGEDRQEGDAGDECGPALADGDEILLFPAVSGG